MTDAEVQEAIDVLKTVDWKLIRDDMNAAMNLLELVSRDTIAGRLKSEPALKMMADCIDHYASVLERIQTEIDAGHAPDPSSN